MLLLFLHEGDGVELRTVVAIVAFSNCAQRNRVEGRGTQMGVYKNSGP